MKTIICREPGFRRCGVAHPARATYPNDAFTDAQWAIIASDAMLEVVEGGEAVAPEPKAPAKAARKSASDPKPSRASSQREDAAAAVAVNTESGGEVVPEVPTDLPADLAADTTARVTAIGDAIAALPKSKVKAGVPDMVALEAALGWRPSEADVTAAVEAKS